MGAPLLYLRVGQFLERVESQLLALPPPGEFRDVSPITGEILAWYARSRSLFSAIRILLKAGYPEEAMILARSLFEASLRFEYLAANDETNRAALVLGEVSRAIEAFRYLDLQRREIKPDSANDAAVDRAIDERSRMIQRAQKRFRVERLRRFPGDQALARRFGHLDSYHGSRIASEFTHGGHLAQASRTRRGDGEVRVFHRSDDPRLAAGVGTLAAEAALYSQRALATILGWDQTIIDDLIRDCADLDRALQETSGDA
jgi:hypothetical protein